MSGGGAIGNGKCILQSPAESPVNPVTTLREWSAISGLRGVSVAGSLDDITGMHPTAASRGLPEVSTCPREQPRRLVVVRRNCLRNFTGSSVINSRAKLLIPKNKAAPGLHCASVRYSHSKRPYMTRGALSGVDRGG